MVFPGENNPRHDLFRVHIGEIRMDGSASRYIVLGERHVRTGTFGAGYSEFYVMRLNPVENRVNEMWVREKTIQESTVTIQP